VGQQQRERGAGAEGVGPGRLAHAHARGRGSGGRCGVSRGCSSMAAVQCSRRGAAMHATGSASARAARSNRFATATMAAVTTAAPLPPWQRRRLPKEWIKHASGTRAAQGGAFVRRAAPLAQPWAPTCRPRPRAAPPRPRSTSCAASGLRTWFASRRASTHLSSSATPCPSSASCPSASFTARAAAAAASARWT
jgi:hypothetical protein